MGKTPEYLLAIIKQKRGEEEKRTDLPATNIVDLIEAIGTIAAKTGNPVDVPELVVEHKTIGSGLRCRIEGEIDWGPDQQGKSTRLKLEELEGDPLNKVLEKISIVSAKMGKPPQTIENIKLVCDL